MKRVIFLLIASAFIWYSVPYSSAQENEDTKEAPGYVDFENLDFFKNIEKKIEVSIKGPLLRFVSKAAEKEDPELSQLLDNLKLIKVDVFPMDKITTSEVESIINRISKELESKNWERMVRVKEAKQRVEIYNQFIGDQLSGLVVMSVSEDEAVFVNIIGNIDPDQLGKLGNKFGIPKLGDIK